MESIPKHTTAECMSSNLQRLLPKEFRELGTSDYLRDVFDLLQRYEWVYDFQLTRFFADSIWQNIPREWHDVLLSLNMEQLNNIPNGYVQEDWPQSLKFMIQQSVKLSLPRQQCSNLDAIKIDKQMCHGMSPKKQHEVANMATYVAKTCHEAQCSMVVDIGSGLGYIDQLIHTITGLSVIGVESQACRSHAAEKRLASQDIALGAVQAVTLNIQDDEDTENKLEELFDNIETLKVAMHIMTDESEERSHSKQCENSQGSSIQEKSPNLNTCCGSGLKGNFCHSKTLSEVTVLPCSLNSTSKTQERNHGKSLCYQNCKSSNLFEHCSCTNEKSKKGDTYTQNDPACTSRMVENTVSKENYAVGEGMTQRVCMIGLHCCGDLSPTMLKLMTKLPHIKALVFVSCCYHNMQYEGDRGFKNFPMSQTIKSYLEQNNITWTLSKFGARLAAQETRSRWHTQTEIEHSEHVKHVAYRSILEEYIDREPVYTRKLRRRIARKKHFESFDIYLEALLDRCEFEGDEFCADGCAKSLKELYQNHENHMKFIEPITCLQVLLQPVLESLILIDRGFYLTEHKFEADILPVFDDLISPRNMAITAMLP